jgi:hypothetical protein
VDDYDDDEDARRRRRRGGRWGVGLLVGVESFINWMRRGVGVGSFSVQRIKTGGA